MSAIEIPDVGSWFHCFAEGVPQPQGSKQAFVVGGRARIVEGNARTLKPWRQQIAACAEAQLPPGWVNRGAFVVTCRFDFARPKSHYTGKGVLRKGVSAQHVQKPDLDKLVRAVLDALSYAGSPVMFDDAMVHQLVPSKRWVVVRSGVYVHVRREG